MAADPTLPPGLPEIQDDAAQTPLWVPGLGLALFMIAAFAMILSATGPDEEVQDEAAAIEAPADEAAEALEVPTPAGH